jgi:hypothetical protein
MWRCRKCENRSDIPSRICRACGGIVEEVPDDQPCFEEVPPSKAKAASQSSLELPSDESIPAAAEADVSRPASQDLGAGGPEWKCPQCGEMIPRNCDACWKCLTTKTAVPTECPRCGSTKIIPGVTILDQGEGSDGKLQVVMFGSPEALIFKDRLYGELNADICGECGHVELRVANPLSLYQHYKKSRGITTWPMSETETEMTWEMKRLLRKAVSCERRGEYEEAVSHLEQFIATTDNAGNVELARTHIRRIEERMSQEGGQVSDQRASPSSETEERDPGRR